MTGACLQYQDLVEKIPAIAEQLHVPTQLARRHSTGCASRIALGKSLRTRPKKSRKRQGNTSGLMLKTMLIITNQLNAQGKMSAAGSNNALKEPLFWGFMSEDLIKRQLPAEIFCKTDEITEALTLATSQIEPRTANLIHSLIDNPSDIAELVFSIRSGGVLALEEHLGLPGQTVKRVANSGMSRLPS